MRGLLKKSSTFMWVVLDLMRIAIICFSTVIFFGSIWNIILLLLGYVLGTPTLISDHLHQFGHIWGSSKNHRTNMQLLWLSSVWVIWNERNNLIFTHKEHSFHQLHDKINLQTFWWLKVKYTTFSFDDYFLWINPSAWILLPTCILFRWFFLSL